MKSCREHESPQPSGGSGAPTQFDRRALLVGSGLAAAGLIGIPLLRELLRQRANVFIAGNQKYEGGVLSRTIRDGLHASGLELSALRGKRVLLKPNLVEPTRDAPHMTTHPAMVAAASEVFRGWGAEVVVGEGPGHVRDTEMALVESGLADALEAVGVPFVDLNYDDLVWVKNAGRASKLAGLYLPRAVAEADLIVSMPKMKTHHWMGVTASMKNMYGVLPGIKYGWPKNVLHYNGIPQTVFDINATVPRTIAIVDGIECMEGDGPIMGSPKHMGLVVVGVTPAAVDATLCRLMQLEPGRIEYLKLAADRLGPIADHCIQQRGEPWIPLSQAFEMLDTPHLQRLRATSGERAS